ncbi:OmpA family protein, partial [Fulvivirga sp. RKSG066]|uniref:OmpA family protein n=1 Tax=Fulvivirga aurantia TaxID=2529383 RepID=UPI0012BD5A83
MYQDAYVEEFKITALPNKVNSKYSEFGAFWKDNNTLIYSSYNSDKLIEVPAEEQFVPPVNLYETKKSGDDWKKPELVKDFSHDYLHSANGSYSLNKKRFVFSRCGQNTTNQIKCDLYVSDYKNGSWSEPEKLGNKINLGSYTSTQPAFGVMSRRGHKTEVLYFSSNRPGGKGQLDIWYTTFKAGDWTEPINCGSAINTIGNEITPYYHGKTKELYFSSDYHNGLGGYDIFKAYGGLKSWKRPENMGITINSGYDDTYFSWREYLKDGTLVSNRTGSRSVFMENCCDDIYAFNYESLSIIEGLIVKNDTTMERLPGVEIGLADLTHLEYPDSVNWISESDDKGSFKLKYKPGHDAYVVVAKEGYETHYIKISDLSKASASDSLPHIAMINDLKWLEKLDKIKNQDVQVLSEQSLSKRVKKGAVFVMEHIYFDFNDATIKPEAYQDLTLLQSYLERNKNTVIEIGGHTDNLGSSEHNHALSQSRADAIKEYLVGKGISASRLIAVGYGEEKPIAQNQFESGADNPEGRRLNRRTEVKILK